MRKALATLVLGSAVGLMGVCLPSAAVASRGDVRISVVASNQAITVRIEATSTSHCTLSVTAGHLSSTLAPVTLTRHGRGTITWTVPPGAPSGKWTFTVSCVRHKKASTSTKRVLLVNHGSGPAGLVNPPGGKGGGTESCAPVASPSSGGQVCFLNDPFATYGSRPGEDIGQCTWYAAGRRPDLDGITTGNASEWLAEAKGKVPEGTIPVVGAIAVNTTADGGLGHVAYVAEVKNNGATLVLDEANVNNDERVYLNIETPASEFQGYIYGGPAGGGEPPPPPSPPPPMPPKTYPETSGPGPTHTFTDYHNASGEGESIPDNSTIQVTCRAAGFEVEDHNTWWYEIASSPYDNTYWASADAFYNNGTTTGSLMGTPFYDPTVPIC